MCPCEYSYDMYGYVCDLRRFACVNICLLCIWNMVRRSIFLKYYILSIYNENFRFEQEISIILIVYFCEKPLCAQHQISWTPFQQFPCWFYRDKWIDSEPNRHVLKTQLLRCQTSWRNIHALRETWSHGGRSKCMWLQKRADMFAAQLVQTPSCLVFFSFLVQWSYMSELEPLSPRLAVESATKSYTIYRHMMKNMAMYNSYSQR
jgi:hypothetical protein